ncbi:hypothetical protein [Mycobacteroides chelonae]|uniref:hypothetical protein n=1 Tax=Mycobacteroides chelonae TaxID=1774 RepID=UPI0008AA1ECF|nr:hypothetical protein [Mycobacteroides chelonae]OHU29061.1 hypothetical protein BKG78_23625 [Mycobacteroides chelonae]
MSVTFNRLQLIKVAESALAAHSKAASAHDADIAKFKADHSEKQALLTRERAVILRDALTKALKRSGPIRYEDVRKANGGDYSLSGRFYSEPSDYDVSKEVTSPRGLMTPAQVVETKALLQVLKSATGDVVTANELKLLGLKNLAPVFTAAGREAAK